MIRVLGLDPGLRHTGWGVVDTGGSLLRPVAAGAVHPEADAPMADRLAQLHRSLHEVIHRYRPAVAAVEETFVNKNATATLKLGQARGVVLLAPALHGLPVTEYAANKIKKSVVGVGHAGKNQVAAMVAILLPGALTAADGHDAADALAVAICHIHHMQTASHRQNAGPSGSGLARSGLARSGLARARLVRAGR